MKKTCKCDSKCMMIILATVGTLAFIVGIVCLISNLLKRRHNDDDIDFCLYGEDKECCDENGCTYADEDDFE